MKRPIGVLIFLIVAVGLAALGWSFLAPPGDEPGKTAGGPYAPAPLEAPPQRPVADRNGAQIPPAKADSGPAVTVSRFEGTAARVTDGIGGVVISDGGVPVSDALCELVVDVSAIRTRTQDGDPQARTRSDGSGLFAFPMSDVPPGQAYLVRVSHADFTVARVGPVTLGAAGAASLRVVLTSGQAVTGFVRDGAGAPIAGATVSFYDQRASALDPVGALEKSATTDGTGSFRAASLSPGLKKVLARHASFATGVIPSLMVPVGADAGRLEFWLDAGLTISGHVAAADTGAPIAGVWVSVQGSPREAVADHRTLPSPKALADPKHPADGTGSDETAAAEAIKRAPDGAPLTTLDCVRTGPDGSYVITGLRVGGYAVAATTSDYLSVTHRPIEAGTSGVDFRLPSLARVLGRVVDDATGQPVPEFRLGFRNSTDDGFPMQATMRAFGPPRFKDGTFDYGSLHAGRYCFVADAPGYAGGRTGEIVLAEGERRTGVEIRLMKGAVIRGRVVDARHQPVIGAFVSFDVAPKTAVPTNPFSALIERVVRRETRDVTTDSAGRFEISTVPAGTYTVSVRHERFAPAVVAGTSVPATGESTLRDIVLTLGAIVRGRVLSNGVPDPKAAVQLTPLDANAIDGPRDAATNAEGRFEFSGLATGSYRISVMKRNDQPDLGAVFGALKGGSAGSSTFVVNPGEVREIDL